MAETKDNFNVRDIIANVLAELKMNAPTFANQIGVDYMRVYNIQRGRTKKISQEMADLICKKFPQVNRMYLYEGTGAVVNEDNNKSLNKDAMSYLERITTIYTRIEALYDKIDDRYNRLIAKEEELSKREIDLLKRENSLA